MEYGAYLDDAFSFTKEGILQNLNRWFSLVIALICLGIPLNGYVMRIYRGTTPAPEADQWGTLFVDGIKLLVVGLVYAIPIIIVWAFIYGSMLLGVFQGTMSEAALESWEPDFTLTLLLYAVEIVIGIFVPVASIRFARTGSFAEAFSIGKIFATIGKIGWIAYLIALIIVTLVIAIPVVIFIIAFALIGGVALYALSLGNLAFLALLAVMILILLIVAPLFTVFQARYMTRVYDSAGPVE